MLEKACGLVSWHPDVSSIQLLILSASLVALLSLDGGQDRWGGCCVLLLAWSLRSHSAHTSLQGLQFSQHLLGQILIDLLCQVAPNVTHLLFPEVLGE